MLLTLTGLGALYSASETAFSAVNRIRVKNKAADGDKKAIRVLKIIENYDETLAAIVIANNLCNIILTTISTILFVFLFGA